MQVPDSARLSYALLDAEDAPLLLALDQDPEVMKYINGGQPSTPEDIAKVMIPRMLRYRNPERGWGLWGVSINATDEFIGWVLVRPMDFFSDAPQWRNLELGWRFMRQSWGQGYATEAAAAIASVCANQPDVDTLSAIALPDNAGSIAVMQKLGMRYLKTDLHRDPLGDHTVVYYAKSV